MIDGVGKSPSDTIKNWIRTRHGSLSYTFDRHGVHFVVLVLSGHYHKAKVDRYRDINFVQLPSPAPNGSHEVTVIRITSDRLLAIPYQYETKSWSSGSGKTLHVPIRGLASGAGEPN